MVVVAVNPPDAKALGMPLALLLTDFVLLAWKDVGVIIEYGGPHAIRHQPLDDGRRTGCTTGMQQHLGATFRNHDGRLFHACKNTKKAGYGKISLKRKGKMFAFPHFFVSLRTNNQLLRNRL
jgi:hypothetical protein